MASGDENADAAVAAQMAQEEAGNAEGPVTWYGDSAYGTGELRAALAAGGHQAVIKPGPLRPAVPGGFTIDDAGQPKAGTCVAAYDADVARVSCQQPSPLRVPRTISADESRDQPRRLSSMPFGRFGAAA
jgi:hypothetical protein